jgi:hypothetical protein
MESTLPRLGPYYVGVAATIEKAGELAAGVEPWLVGSPPPGITELADAFDSSVRLSLATVEFGSSVEDRINRMFLVSANLRSAYRAASEVIRLLTIMDPGADIRAPFAMAGDALVTQARLAPPSPTTLGPEAVADNSRRGVQTERSALSALVGLKRETLAGGHYATRRIQRACLMYLAISGGCFAEALTGLGPEQATL